MKAQKTIKVSDRVHGTATRLAAKLGVSKSLLIDLLMRKLDAGEVTLVPAIHAPNGIAIAGDNNGTVIHGSHREAQQAQAQQSRESARFIMASRGVAIRKRVIKNKG